MTWYMRSATDRPHRQDPDRPAQTICGLPMAGAKEVTDDQIAVYLGGKHCPTCDWHAHPRKAVA